MKFSKKKSIRHIKHLKYNSHTAEHFKELEYLKLSDLITFNQSVFVRNYSNKKLPSSFDNFLSPVPDQGVRRVRGDEYNYFSSPVNFADLHFFPTPQLIYKWNNLPLVIKSVSDISNFRSDLKRNFISKYETICHEHNCYSCPRLS